MLPNNCAVGPPISTLIPLKPYTTKGKRAFIKEKEPTQHCTHQKTHLTLSHKWPSFCPLSTDPFNDPNSASCATLLHDTRCSVRVAATAPTAKTKREGRATFFPKKRGKQRIFSFSCENETNKTKHKTFIICFLIYMDLYILIFYRFYCKTEKVYNRLIKFPTFVFCFFFWFFLVDGWTLSLWLSFRISL